MSARLVMTSGGSAWSVARALDAVEQRCRDILVAAPSDKSNLADPAAEITDAALYHLHSGGRRIRAQLALDSAHALGLSVRTAIAIATTCELLHNASLVHDDLQDRDCERRGSATVWKKFNDDTAICTGDLLLSAAYASLAEVEETPKLAAMLGLMHARTASAICGQAADLGHKTTAVRDTDTYLRIVVGKSGAFLSLPIELTLLAADHDESRLLAQQGAHAFAIGYQIADDIDDLAKDTDVQGAGSALNYVLLHHALLRDRDQALAHATAVAREHLAHAESAAMALPRQCGTLLAQLAHQLCARF